MLYTHSSDTYNIILHYYIDRMMMMMRRRRGVLVTCVIDLRLLVYIDWFVDSLGNGCQVIKSFVVCLLAVVNRSRVVLFRYYIDAAQRTHFKTRFSYDFPRLRIVCTWPDPAAGSPSVRRAVKFNEDGRMRQKTNISVSIIIMLIAGLLLCVCTEYLSRIWASKFQFRREEEDQQHH